MATSARIRRKSLNSKVQSCFLNLKHLDLENEITPELKKITSNSKCTGR